MPGIERTSCLCPSLGRGPIVAISTSAPSSTRAAARSTEYRHTPPTASAVINTLRGLLLSSIALAGMPGFQFDKWLRPLLLDVAEGVETLQISLMRSLPREIVRGTPDSRIFR